MRHPKTTYICSECGAATLRWEGRCTECGEWNSLVEHVVEPSGDDGRSTYTPVDGDRPLPLTDAPRADYKRISTGIAELDGVLGGGVVPGSAILIGGDPGIGKSTLMLQMGAALADGAGAVMYVSGEESFAQVKLRAERLDAISERVHLLAETEIDRIRARVDAGRYTMVIVDSIQAMHTSRVPAGAGTIGQVRECAIELTRLAKGLNIPVVLVGHVTKEGAIAGPRVLEHLVDTVLYFDGEGRQDLRILRAVKNRFGSTNEIGVFEMTDRGLVEVASPSEVFLTERTEGVAGSVVLPAIEGSRPILVEVQALVTRSGYGTPRRTVTGVNPNRVSLILAAMEKWAGLPLHDRDVFVNIAGGIRVDEPAADLAIAMALASSCLDRPVIERTTVFGEIGLAGEVRAAAQGRRRVQEAERLGYMRCIVPRGCARDVAGCKSEKVFVDNLSAGLAAGLRTGENGAN